MDRQFPREVVISPDHSAGLITWWGDSGMSDERLYDLIEHLSFIDCARNKIRWSDVMIIMSNEGFDLSHCYPGGWGDAEVVTVFGPYRVEEYDGHESISYRDDQYWRE